MLEFRSLLLKASLRPLTRSWGNHFIGNHHTGNHHRMFYKKKGPFHRKPHVFFIWKQPQALNNNSIHGVTVTRIIALLVNVVYHISSCGYINWLIYTHHCDVITQKSIIIVWCANRFKVNLTANNFLMQCKQTQYKSLIKNSCLLSGM